MENVLLISTTDHYASLIGFCLWLGFLGMFLYCFVDVFRRHDFSGWRKAGWVVFLFFVPFIGIILYLIVRPREQTSFSEARAYEMTAHRAAGPADAATAEADIAHADALLAAGTITQAQYQDRVWRAQAGLPPTEAPPDFLKDSETK